MQFKNVFVLYFMLVTCSLCKAVPGNDVPKTIGERLAYLSQIIESNLKHEGTKKDPREEGPLFWKVRVGRIRKLSQEKSIDPKHLEAAITEAYTAITTYIRQKTSE